VDLARRVRAVPRRRHRPEAARHPPGGRSSSCRQRPPAARRALRDAELIVVALCGIALLASASASCPPRQVTPGSARSSARSETDSDEDPALVSTPSSSPQGEGVGVVAARPQQSALEPARPTSMDSPRSDTFQTYVLSSTDPPRVGEGLRVRHRFPRIEAPTPWEWDDFAACMTGYSSTANDSGVYHHRRRHGRSPAHPQR
jgi:hypothetical protein